MSKRRGHGDGAIHQRPDGRWEARLDLGWMDGRRQRRSIYGKTRTEVATKLRAAQGRTDRGLPLDDRRMTVAELLRKWLAYQELSEKAPNTIASYRWSIEKHLIPALGKVRLVELSADHVDGMLAARARRGAAKSTLVRLRSTLKMALDYAVRRDYVARNVATLTEVPAGYRKAGRSLTLLQATAFLRQAEGDALEGAFITQLLLGLRPGEVLGLAWQYVDLEGGTIRIRQSLRVEKGSAAVLGPLKTASSRRTLALPAPVVAALRVQRRVQREQRMKAGPAWVDSGLVFTTTVGTPVHPRNYRRSLSRITERAGLGSWHPHELRHSAVSLLSAAGLRLEDIADIVGHSSTRMTAEVYRHHVEPTISAGKAAMDAMFPNFGGQLGGQTPASGL